MIPLARGPDYAVGHGEIRGSDRRDHGRGCLRLRGLLHDCDDHQDTRLHPTLRRGQSEDFDIHVFGIVRITRRFERRWKPGRRNKFVLNFQHFGLLGRIRLMVNLTEQNSSLSLDEHQISFQEKVFESIRSGGTESLADSVADVMSMSCA